MRDIETILKDSAFDCLDDNVKNLIRILYKNIQGKTIQQSLPYIMGFVNSLPKGIKLTQEQKMAIVEALTETMSEQEKNNLMKMLKLFNF